MYIVKKKSDSHSRKGFTLVELLVVIAIIGILSSMIFVGVSKGLNMANKTQIQSRIVAMASAITNFKAEYGYYPTIFENEEEFVLDNAVRRKAFYESLSGKDENNSPIGTGGNRKRISFMVFDDNEYKYLIEGDEDYGYLSGSMDDVVVYVDKNGDGVIEIKADRTFEVRADVAIYVTFEDEIDNDLSVATFKIPEEDEEL